MANDRLFLVCPRCGEHFMLAKHYGDQWETRTHGEPLEDQLDAFFKAHWICEYVGNDPYEFWLMNEEQSRLYEESRKAKT